MISLLTAESRLYRVCMYRSRLLYLRSIYTVPDSRAAFVLAYVLCSHSFTFIVDVKDRFSSILRPLLVDASFFQSFTFKKLTPHFLLPASFNLTGVYARRKSYEQYRDLDRMEQGARAALHVL